MKKTNVIGWLLSGTLLCSACASMDKPESTEVLQAIPFQQVTLEDNFWLPRLKTQKEVLVPFALDKVRPAMDNLRKQATTCMASKTSYLSLTVS